MSTTGPSAEDIAEFVKIRNANIAKRNARLIRVMGPEAAKALFGIKAGPVTAPLPAESLDFKPDSPQTTANSL